MNPGTTEKIDRLGLSAVFLISCAVAVLVLFEKTELIGYSLLGVTAIPLLYLLFFNKAVFLQITIFMVPLSLKLSTRFFGSAISVPSELFLSALVLVSIPIFFFAKRIDRRILLHPITILLIIDTAWMSFTCLTSEMPEVSIKRVVMRILFITGYYFVFAHLFKRSQLLIRPLLLYAIGLVPAIVYIWRSHAHYNFDPRAAFSISQPFYSDHTIYGACIAFVIPAITIVIYNSRLFRIGQFAKICLIIVAALLYVAEFLAYSRGALITVVLIVFLYLLMKKVRLHLWHLLSFLFVLATFSFIYSGEITELARSNDAVSNDGNIGNHYKSVTNITRDASNLERINRWICAYRMFEQRPLTGYGPGTYQFQYTQFQTSESKTYISTMHGDRGNAHSEYLTYLSETGIVGFISFLCLTLYTLYLGINLYYQCLDHRIKCVTMAATLGLVTFFVHGIFNSFIDQDKMAALVFSALAILVAIDIYHKLQPTNTNGTSIQ